MNGKKLTARGFHFAFDPKNCAILQPLRGNGRMVQIGAPPRVHVRHQDQYAMTLQHSLPGGDVVAGLARDRGIGFDMRVDVDHIVSTALRKP